MTSPRPYKLRPGSFAAQSVELLRFLPRGTELRTTELCARLNRKPPADFAKQLAPAVRIGLLHREKRRVSDRPGNAVFWMAGAIPAPGAAPGAAE